MILKTIKNAFHDFEGDLKIIIIFEDHKMVVKVVWLARVASTFFLLFIICLFMIIFKLI